MPDPTSEATSEGPGALLEEFPEFDTKYRELNQLLVKLWEAHNTGSTPEGELLSRAKEASTWAKKVIETYHPLEEFEEMVRKDTATFATGARLAKDDLLLKQLYLTWSSLVKLLEKGGK